MFFDNKKYATEFQSKEKKTQHGVVGRHKLTHTYSNRAHYIFLDSRGNLVRDSLSKKLSHIFAILMRNTKKIRLKIFSLENKISIELKMKKKT